MSGVGNNQPQRRLGGVTGKGFLPGKSGNPNGRPKGSVKLRELLAPELEEVAKRLVEGAKRGDPVMLREYLDRVCGKPVVGEPDDEGKQAETVLRIITGVPRE